LKKQKVNFVTKAEQEKAASDTSLSLISVQVPKRLGEHERLTIAQMEELSHRSIKCVRKPLKIFTFRYFDIFACV